MMNNWQGVMPSTYPGFESWLKYDFDPAKAKKLLAEAGFPDGFDAELTFDAAQAAMESIGILLQSDFKKAGINLSLRKLPTAAASDYVQGKKGSLALWTDMPIQPDINYALKLVWPTGALVNYHNFSDPKVDQVLKDGEGVIDPAERIKAHAGIQEHIHDQAPLGWIGEQYFAVGLSRKISNFRWYTTQYYHVNEMSISD
jgi:peptide/nickel transport system substrate-binding protein